MNERMPQTDAEWAERLGAYLDGELDGAERQNLERALARDPARARELETLRDLRGALQAWTVESPEPSPAFLQRFHELEAMSAAPAPQPPSRPQAPPRETWADWLRRALLVPWPVAALIFFAGMLAGGGGTQLLHQTRLSGQSQQPLVVALAPPSPRAEMRETAATASISTAQARALQREAQAAALRDQLLRQLDRRDLGAAARSYRQLWADYPDTAAARQFSDNPTLRRAAQQFERLGRI